MSMEHVLFAKEELERRSKAPVRVKSEEIWGEGREPYRTTFIVDSRIGWNNHAIRFWIRSLPPGDEEGGGWKSLGHRHTVEAVIYILEGRGNSIIDNVRYDWEAGDFICVPIFAWHRHINSGATDVVYSACTSGPMSMGLGIAIYEDERYPEYWVYAQQSEEARRSLIPGKGSAEQGAIGSGKRQTEEKSAREIYLEQVEFAEREEERRRRGKVLIKGKDLVFEDTPMGRVALAVDPRRGCYVKTLSSLIAEILPGQRSGAHRHVYEEINYVLAGKGYSIIDDQRYEWKAGDALSIPIFAWHQHFNGGDEPARFLVHTDRIAMENLGYAVTQHGESAR
jgi:quercetin dioxygenase-like cupin family protein